MLHFSPAEKVVWYALVIYEDDDPITQARLAEVIEQLDTWLTNEVNCMNPVDDPYAACLDYDHTWVECGL